MTTTSPNPAPETSGSPGSSPTPTAGLRLRGRKLLTFVAAMAAILALAWVALPRIVGAFAPHLYSGTILQGDAPAPGFDGLVGADGEAYDLAAHDGDLVLVYFGYTHCPDVCPTTLATVARARTQIGAADDIALVMVGVDPERDTPEALGSYVSFFDPTFEAATGPEAAVAEVASAYGVYFERTEADAGGDYDFDHTATLMGISPDGALRILWPPDVDADALAADLAELAP